MVDRKYKYRVKFDFDVFYIEAANYAEAEHTAKSDIMCRVFLAHNFPVTKCSVSRYKGKIQKSLEAQIADCVCKKLENTTSCCR